VEKEVYIKPELKSDTVEIGTYGQYEIISPNCVVVAVECC